MRYKLFDCQGRGFTFEGHARADNTTILRALDSQKAPTDVAAKKAKSWWKAQVMLYGLTADAWTPYSCQKSLKVAMSKGPLKVPADLKEAEERINKEYFDHKKKVDENLKIAKEKQERKAKERDEKYRAASTDQEKVTIDFARFLKEKFMDDNRDLLTLREPDYCSFPMEIHRIAEKLGLFLGTTLGIDDRRYEAVIISRSKEVLAREQEHIEQEVERKKTLLHERKLEEREQRRQDFIKQSDEGNDPSGHWILHMPEYYKAQGLKEYGIDEDCTLDIPPFDLQSGSMYVGFDFLEFVGNFKIDVYGKSNWRDEEMNFDWEGDVKEVQYSGCCPCDSEINYDDDNFGTITFTSPTECHGSIEGWFRGPYPFRGFKVKNEAGVTAEKCKADWDENKEYHQRARKRWLGEYSDEEMLEDPGESDDENVPEGESARRG